MLGWQIISLNLTFQKPAKTSRNTFKEKTVYLVKIFNFKNPEIFGIGEAAPLALLSPEPETDYKELLQNQLEEFCRNNGNELPDYRNYPSIAFAIESAWNDLKTGSKLRYFSSSDADDYKIKINGLVWMNDAQTMLQEALEKAEQGFDCIKFKVGALDFDAECNMLHQFRKKYSSSKVQIRLDANGAFHPSEVKEQMKLLAKYHIHSIEQPVKPNFADLLAELSRQSVIDIALDESLIGNFTVSEKSFLIKEIKPAYLILKPTLHGGITGTEEWIEIADTYKIPYWFTSALESNIGLNIIARLSLKYPSQIHQGLGTGSLYTNNIQSPLQVAGGYLVYNGDTAWKLPN